MVVQLKQGATEGRIGQFFIITAVLISGSLLLITNMLATSQSVDYGSVLEGRATDIVQNVDAEIQSQWWDTAWDWRQRIVVEERSGAFLENASVPITVNAERSEIQDSCHDIRAVSRSTTLPWVNTTACNIDTYESETEALLRFTFENTTAGTVEDTTGNGFEGELDGGSEVSGRFRTGMKLETGDSIAVEDDGSGDLDFGPGDSFTVSLWVKLVEENDGWNSIFAKGGGEQGETPNYGLRHHPENGLDFTVGASDVSVGGPSLTKRTWHHIAGVYSDDTGETSLYVDGDRASSGDATPSTNDAELYIGEPRNGDGAHMVVEDFRVYNKSLVQPTIEGIARNGVGVNVSMDLEPFEQREVQLYVGNPEADDPGYTGEHMVQLPPENAPAVSRDVPRGIREVMRQVQERVERLDRSLGASVQFMFQQGCNQLTYTAPETVLRKDIC